MHYNAHTSAVAASIQCSGPSISLQYCFVMVSGGGAVAHVGIRGSTQSAEGLRNGGSLYNAHICPLATCHCRQRHVQVRYCLTNSCEQVTHLSIAKTCGASHTTDTECANLIREEYDSLRSVLWVCGRGEASLNTTLNTTSVGSQV